MAWLCTVVPLVVLTHTAVAQPPVVATPCDKYLPANAVSGLLVGKPTINRYSEMANLPGDGCEWGVSGPAEDFAMVDFAIVHVPQTPFSTYEGMSPGGKPLPGVGDRADAFATKDSNIPNAKETDFMARKGDFMCFAELDRTDGPPGEKLIVTDDDQALAIQLGKLCTIGFGATP
jgi:hypothetical protein